MSKRLWTIASLVAVGLVVTLSVSLPASGASGASKASKEPKTSSGYFFEEKDPFLDVVAGTCTFNCGSGSESHPADSAGDCACLCADTCGGSCSVNSGGHTITCSAT